MTRRLIWIGGLALLLAGCAEKSDRAVKSEDAGASNRPAAVKSTGAGAERRSGMGEMVLINTTQAATPARGDAPPAPKSGPSRASAAPVKVPAPVTNDDPRAARAAELRERARMLWQARVDNDYDTWFGMLDSRVQSYGDVAAFREFCETREPFLYEAFEITATEVDGDMGWVDVNNRVKMRQMPRIPPRDVVTSEKWHYRDGAWVPIPRPEAPFFPVSPSRRDAFEESRVRERWEETWRIRAAVQEKEDFAPMLDFCDPRDVAHVAVEEWNELNNMWRYLNAEIVWIEAVKGSDTAQVRVKYTRKINDPSMTKQPPQDDLLTEEWVRVDEQWYVNLKSDDKDTQ